MQVDKPKGAPAWMPAKIWKPMVKKVGMENPESTEPPVEKVVDLVAILNQEAILSALSNSEDLA